MLPYLKWPGGKRWLVDKVRPLWSELPEDTILIELFAGAAALSLGLECKYAVLNDQNVSLAMLHQAVQFGLAIDGKGPVRMENSEACYYCNRSLYNNLAADEDPAVRGQLLYYLVKTSFNGLVRYNKRGKFNAPFGLHRSIQYEIDLAPYTEQMKRWEVSHGDFSEVIMRPGDLVFADPPYDGQFGGYCRTPFTWADQVRLVDLLYHHDGPVIACNAPTPRVLELYERAGFQIELIDAPRSISRDGSQRGAVKEMFAVRW